MSTQKESIESSRSERSRSRAASTEREASIEYSYAALGQGEALYPAVDVRLELASMSVMPIQMLPDSGASGTVLPRKFVVPLGFDLRDCTKVPVDTGSGMAFHFLAPASVRAWIAGREIHLHPCFSDIGVPVLGRQDFFNEFHVQVDERRRSVTITPHDLREAVAAGAA